MEGICELSNNGATSARDNPVSVTGTKHRNVAALVINLAAFLTALNRLSDTKSLA